ncbi:steroid transmembrane transporter SLC22A24-like isoform X1 [Diceros bicornis minor]|uniref:steroid transmembrane transporter SLC22A24-like isoform X1 n=1 Tax=Diceros bicornis minor TaxID=77932 RepID=UPI0026F22896|nr:steroid transmembrane transporter SLC22A24-like isoform X1 [Diceros bicornis minor]
MAFQDLLDQVGSLGRFQVLQTAFFCVCILIVYPHMLLENFTAAIPGHRCWVHILDNDTVSANGTEILSQDALLRISIPLDSNSKPEKSRRFLHPQWQFLHMNGTFPNMSEPDTEPCVDGWVYDQSSFPSTIATEWDLVCESQSLISVAQSLFMAAQLLGALIFGHLSDRFGRKMVFRWCLLKFAVVNTCATFAPTFLVYCSLHFLGGMCIITIVANCFIIMSEWTGPKSIALMAGIIINFCSVGQTLLGGLAFAIRDWRTLQLTMSIPFFVIFLTAEWLVESAQWLIVTHQLDEGLKELRRVADINGKKDAGETLTIEFVKSTMREELDASQTKASLIHLFRTPKLHLRVCCLCFVRMATSLPFFGLLLNLQHLGSNIFLFQIIFGAVTFAIRCAVLLTMNHMGRRMSQMLSSFLVGISILVNTFLSQEMQTLRVALAALGIGAATVALTFSSIHHIELSPTVIRSIAGGVNAMFSRIGGALAPLLVILRVYSPHLPWILYGAFPILAGLVVLFLPETRNQPIPNTIQDVENNRRVSRETKQKDISMKVTQF